MIRTREAELRELPTTRAAGSLRIYNCKKIQEQNVKWRSSLGCPGAWAAKPPLGASNDLYEGASEGSEVSLNEVPGAN